MKKSFRSVYIAFDQYPSYKGAATHIDHMVKVLSENYGPTLLLTVEGPKAAIISENITQLCFTSEEENILKRALSFSKWVNEHLQHLDTILIGHFRDVWGGMAVLEFPHITPIFEVNGIPSIEWPYRYPHLNENTKRKLSAIEDHCFRQTALILAPSNVICTYIANRKIDSEKIKCLSNGASIPPLSEKPLDLPNQYIVYFGALQPWQGVDVLFKSLRYLEDKTEIKLIVCASHTEHHCKPYKKFAEKLGIAEKIIWKYQLEKNNLTEILQHAYASIAPLTECSRNLEQGCSPLKIFESMACGVPVVASDLPAIREIVTNDVDGVLVRPGRPAELARAIRILFDYPEHRNFLALNATHTIHNRFTWQRIEKELSFYYSDVYSFSFGYKQKWQQYG